MERSLVFVNLLSGSFMAGGFLFGAVTVARAHVTMPPPAAWDFHRFVSRRVDWFMPASALTATVTGWSLLVVGPPLVGAARSLTLVGALLLTSYGPLFLVHRTGLRNEFLFVQVTVDDLAPAEVIQRMRWWNRWHHYRTVVGVAAHVCFIGAALVS